MNENCTGTGTEDMPLHMLLRHRRHELKLTQAEVAHALNVTPECIVVWENGRRRMELSKLPRIAGALRLDPKELCAKALAEFYPAVFAVLDDASNQSTDPKAA